MVGSGQFATVEEACHATIRESARQAPEDELTTIYAAGHSVFRELYPALKPTSPKMRARPRERVVSSVARPAPPVAQIG